jgi:hypothetical protein
MNSFNCWIILSASAFLLLLISTTASSQEATSLQDEDLSNSKRAWKDVGASWGKRGWKDMQVSSHCFLKAFVVFFIF